MTSHSSEQVGIVGSGAIGIGLARLVGPENAVLWCRSEESAKRARDALGPGAKVVSDLSALADRTLVVEAVAEDAAVKSSLLARLDAVLADDALLASTTSSLSIAELAAASSRPNRFCALHVFNPVEKMRLVEVCFPAAASADTRARITALCESLERTVVEVPDSAGFVVNRLLFPYLFDAVRFMGESGLAPDAVDTCMKLGAGHPMGPLALLDFVGLDVAAAIGESLGVEVPATVVRLVAEGRLGRKAGAGFYDYG